MTSYRKARTLYLWLLIIAVLGVAGFVSALQFINLIPEDAIKAISTDLARLIAISLVLYGSYNLDLEWAALNENQRDQGAWRRDYITLQTCGWLVIFVGYLAEFFRSSANDFATIRQGWVVEAWGAGFVLGLFILSFMIHLRAWSGMWVSVMLLRILFLGVLVGNLGVQVILLSATHEVSRFISFWIVVLWSCCSFFYPIVLIRGAIRPSRIIQP